MKMENEEITYHDTRGIFENGRVVNYTGNPRAVFEQQNQKMCYEVLKEKVVKKRGPQYSISQRNPQGSHRWVL